ncbi:CbiX/SirB N-terminal domain-containing protein [Actinacidiphila glaucinigra]|uniref:sirohydrochlorin chelatase n=1 Tax=Actinacidiphila glaucinigra TaxID=235986 RepID=UPI0033A513FD
MTAEQPAPHGAPGPDHFDSTAQLMSRITAQLSSRLSRVTLRSVPPRPPVLIAVAHGSRDPEALRTAHALLDRVRDLRPGLPVRLGHIEIDEPPLDDALAALTGEVVLVPLMLTRGHHVARDVPEALARAPHLRGRVAAPLGPHPLLAEALYDRLAEAGWRTGSGRAARRAGVVLAAAGSRNPRSARDTQATAALLRARLGGDVPVVPAYASAGPDVATAVRRLAAEGRDRVAVASCFAAPGRFATATAAAAPWIAAAPLGAHPAMAALVLHRYDRALAGTAGSAAAAQPATA